ncbi:DUF3872 domain-containing protein [Sphingobacterium athyrii]|uniref:Conjugal transfer protein TraQ n=1 Tax=Sphingobacterium athyrii TaxID=2152717 RepID=A0A363NUI7_9SPHI|nr:DUF3872 domain-containing protein [Sphingobacterium athyrii]PUV24427.1 conjugal transfer protein TraQ [Sphingobacterium athyrii]
MKNLISRWHTSAGSLFIGLIGIFGILFLTGCEKETLDVQEVFPFEVKVMPVPKEIAIFETVEIRISIIANGNYLGNKYYIRYFQNEGHGRLRYYDHKPYVPNDSYLIEKEEFRLYYTSESTVSQSFDVWITDSFGNEKQFTLQFKNKKFDPIIIGPIR